MPARIWGAVPAIAALLALLLSVGLVACGSMVTASLEEETMRENSAAATTAAPVASRGATAAPQATQAPMLASEEEASEGGSTGFYQNTPLNDEALRSIVPQNRVIVRTVDIGIIVPNVPRSREEIALLAEDFGGWEVNSERTQRHEASISVRVPAELLGQFLQRLRDTAAEVEFENSTSQDVTADFVDNEARLNVLRRTEARLLEFHSRAVNVEETVNLEAELSRVQLEIEGIQGRLRFMAETSAYSLVNVVLTTAPGEMPVEFGSDATFRAGESAKFRATFRPPAGVDTFNFTWDFGDGSEPVEGTRTASTTNAGERVTATVSHTYTNVQESPYIVRLDVRGIGDAGIFLGTDTVIATVTQIPGIEVFAGEDRVADEGDEVEYTGSFTRPESLTDFRYRWDFGDGSATVFEVPEEGETRAVAKHSFPDYRPDPYPVVLTVIAQSEAGEIRGSSTFNVRVAEVEGFVVAGWNVGATFKSAVRALSVVGKVLLTIVIWVGIFSPMWLVVIAAVIFVPRIMRRFGWSLSSVTSVPVPPAPWQSRRSDAVPATPVGAVPPPEPGSQASPVAEGEPAVAEEEEQPTLLCSNCEVVYPGIDASGRPARFCPSCGAEAPSPDDEERLPNA
jgi:hypothetical protein